MLSPTVSGIEQVLSEGHQVVVGGGWVERKAIQTGMTSAKPEGQARMTDLGSRWLYRASAQRTANPNLVWVIAQAGKIHNFKNVHTHPIHTWIQKGHGPQLLHPDTNSICCGRWSAHFKGCRSTLAPITAKDMSCLSGDTRMPLGTVKHLLRL